MYSRYIQRQVVGIGNRRYSTLLPWVVSGTVKSRKIVKANDCFIYTKDKRFIDFTSGLMVVNLGHNNKYILEGFKEHAATGISYINSLFETDQREKLSESLVEVSGLENGKVFYTNGGGDANETAVFLAHEYQNTVNFNNKKQRILTFEKSFHGGSTIGATLLSGDERKKPKTNHYSLPFESIIPNPLQFDGGLESLKQLAILFQNNDVAAIIVEGSSGSAGCINYPVGYLKQVENICKHNKVLLICDEVMSGFGRTGSMFAYQQHQITPDIVTIAKGFTSGYVPLGGVIISKKIASIYDEKPFVHGLTYFAHPLACFIANKCMDLYLEDDQCIIGKVKQKGHLLGTLGRKMKDEIDIVKDYRNNGLLGCIELNITDTDKLAQISNNLMDRGVYCFRRNNLIFTAPPITVHNTHITETMETIARILNNAQWKP